MSPTATDPSSTQGEIIPDQTSNQTSTDPTALPIQVTPSPAPAPPASAPAPFSVTMDDFQTGFKVVDLSGLSKPVNVPYYYTATLAGAQALQAHMNALGYHPAISMDFPTAGWNSPRFQPQNAAGETGDAAKVPYLDFINPGQATDSNPTGLMHMNAAGMLDQYFVGESVAFVDLICVPEWFAGCN